MNIFAKALAEASSKEQAEFFNDFSRALALACGSRDESQICYITEDLDSNSRKVVCSLSDFIKLNEETRPKLERSLCELRREQYEIEKKIAELKELDLEEKQNDK